jgi:chaperone modulatory protein CbpM
MTGPGGPVWPAVFAVGVWIEGEQALELEAFAIACGAEVGFVHQLVDEGLLQLRGEPPAWRFGGEALARARRIRRLQRDFDASLQSVAVMLDLIDEIERLRARLRCQA